ncbi:peptidoglycan-binding protein [Thauera sinica]|nr:peptidoglycan-binding protein [Thauera sp. K11]
MDGELMQGDDVKALQQALADRGFSPGRIDSVFGAATDAAVRAFQRSEGDLLVDGQAGPRTRARLGLARDAALPSVADEVTPLIVARMLPDAPIDNIKANLGSVLDGLRHFGLTDKTMVLMALATIAAETAGFEPLDEFRSRFNTSPGGHPFDLYDNRRDLGNRGAPDGARYKGRGYIQLTGRSNYGVIGATIGVDLEGHPDRANEAATAGLILACYLKDRELKIKSAIIERDFARARRQVNGGTHGLGNFQTAYLRGEKLI